MWLWKLEIDLFIIIRRRFNLVHAINLLELALSLSSFGVFCPEPVYKFHEPGDFPLLMFKNRQLLLLVSFSLGQVIIIVAAVAQQTALPNFNDAANQLV